MKMEVSERILELHFLIMLSAKSSTLDNGKFDGGQLTDSEKSLRDFIRGCLISVSSSALMGDFQEIQTVNRQSTLLAGIYALHDGQTQKTNCGH
jgi:hypothetical protein